MNLEQIALWVAQWLLVEVSKRFPVIGNWVKANAPAVVALLATIVTFLQGLFHPPSAVAQTVTDTLGVAVGVAVPVVVTSGFMGWIGNAAGTILADNVLRKILWHWIAGKVLGVEAAKSKHVKVKVK